MACHLDAFLGANDQNGVGVVLEARDRDLGGGRQLQIGQFLALRAQNVAMVLLWNLYPAARLHNQVSTCRSILSMM